MQTETRITQHKTADPLALQRAAQITWASAPLSERLRMLRRLRHLLAENTSALLAAISPVLARTPADTLVAEVLPLLDACKFLEQNAARILAPRSLGHEGRPIWLTRVQASIERTPLGIVLIIAPSNYPLFIAATQTLQALAAGNAVVWKPGRAARAAAEAFAALAARAGLPKDLLRITDESPEAATAEIEAHPDLIIFTGSAKAGRAVQHLAAECTIPVVAELSGCDSVFVLPGAEQRRVTDALCFGMRLNGSATCMAPRRLMLVGAGHTPLVDSLRQRFKTMEPIFLSDESRTQLSALLDDAKRHGAQVDGEVGDLGTRPVLVMGGSSNLLLATADVFAPVLTVTQFADLESAVATEEQSPLGLTATIFGSETDACALGARLRVGTVVINDLIVPTADPRVPFGGRRGSGFGTTRGAEGLLTMTAAKTVTVRRGHARTHYQATTAKHVELFTRFIQWMHGRNLRTRFAGLAGVIAAARKAR